MENLAGYDKWKTTPPDDPEAEHYCSRCGAPIYEGDYLYAIDGEKLCEDCLNDEYRRMA